MVLTGTFAAWRLELFFKSRSELQSLVPFLKRNNVIRVNLTNKNAEDDLTGWVKCLSDSVPDLHVCTHWSIKFNYRRSAQGTHQEWLSFCREVSALRQNSVLLVSGGGKKRVYNTVTALQTSCSPSGSQIPDVDVYVAFNPYLPQDQMEGERKRLTQKLETGCVRGVYLQMGTDTERLATEIAFLRQQFSELCQVEPQIFGSIFVPSKQLLAQMRYRPWNGVFLSQEYLTDVPSAEALTTKILRIYHRAEVVPLVESRVSDDKQLQHVLHLLSSGCATNSSDGQGKHVSGRGHGQCEGQNTDKQGVEKAANPVPAIETDRRSEVSADAPQTKQRRTKRLLNRLQ